METETLNKIEKESGPNKGSFVLESLGPVNSIEAMEEDTPAEDQLLSKKINIQTTKKTNKVKNETKKVDPEMELEGNQKLNQIKKKQFKKEKKMRNRREKVAQQLARGLENFTITNKDKEVEDYNFDEDFVEK